MTAYPVRTRRWTRAEYDRLMELGMLTEGEHVELIGGELLVREPQGSPHFTAVRLVARAEAPRSGPGGT